MRALVAITTYNRPAMLLDAVRSARAQVLPDGIAARVLVVDNSRDANARDAVLVEAARTGLPLHYLSIPEPNISLARNAALAACDDDWLAFMDDDQVASTTWLANLIATGERTGADVVFGAVLPIFPAGPPSWDPTGRSLTRDIALPDGSPIGLDHDARLSGLWIGTNGCLLRSATTIAPHAGAAPAFNPALGRTGGEDYDFFVRLHAAGRRFVWCADAPLREVIPAERLTTAYRRARSFRAGQLYARITLEHARSRVIATAELAARAAVQLVLVSGLWGLGRLRGSPDADRRSLKVAEVAGKLFWGGRPSDHV
ncbi:glycosyltransferase family 2 protein [Roseomonas populi]|uniref:Glycosyltransferase n=1 Tax=Roseomonas populi TaxID=3121582 RepID=A0ABT1X4J7_9PROT|nr:glycosyltransferase family 2 protein [Roseomonas pecuniae]MCR0982323.1 glycosyltransferase [Roseomonas pecuniae]